jgi:uncharacterized membrane protein
MDSGAAFTLVVDVIRWLLAAAFAFMGVLHFLPGPRRGMAAMIPPRLRGRDPRTPARLVAFTGVCELAGAVGLLIPGVRYVAAVALIVFLIAVFPANAYAAQHRDRFGAIATPFWPRLLMQIVLAGLLALTLAT